MKNFFHLLSASLLLTSCGMEDPSLPYREQTVPSKEEVAGILARLPLSSAHLREVYDAVSSSSGNGYDEEYMMSDLFTCPGSGVGDIHSESKASAYESPLRDLFSDYLRSIQGNTKSSTGDVQAYIDALCSSDLQIYWPFSEDWDGVSCPVITFDPGYNASSNYGYILDFRQGTAMVVDSLLVTEEVARNRPVWVINSNDDCEFSPFEPYTKAAASSKNGKMLIVESFVMHRNYDSWFAGASEFWIKCGAVNGFKASSEADLKLYSPSVTDMMIVVKRKDLGKEVPFDSILLSDLTSQMEKLAFMIVEDDGGTTTSWKCSATVKYNSKSYGFELDIPYKNQDDLVWRGQLPGSFFLGEDRVTGRFGDVSVTFRTE